MHDTGGTGAIPAEPTAQAATDAVLDNFAWCLTRAEQASPEIRVGFWMQTAMYAPSVLARLRMAERERDAYRARLRQTLHQRRDLLVFACQAAATGERLDPRLLIAYLSEEEGV